MRADTLNIWCNDIRHCKGCQRKPLVVEEVGGLEVWRGGLGHFSLAFCGFLRGDEWQRVVPVAMPVQVAYSALPNVIYDKQGTGALSDFTICHLDFRTFLYCLRGVRRASYWSSNCTLSRPTATGLHVYCNSSPAWFTTLQYEQTWKIVHHFQVGVRIQYVLLDKYRVASGPPDSSFMNRM